MYIHFFMSSPQDHGKKQTSGGRGEGGFGFPAYSAAPGEPIPDKRMMMDVCMYVCNKLLPFDHHSERVWGGSISCFVYLVYMCVCDRHACMFSIFMLI